MVNLEEEELKNNVDDDSDAESKIINPPYKARVPAYRMSPDGPMPHGHTIIEAGVASRGYDYPAI